MSACHENRLDVDLTLKLTLKLVLTLSLHCTSWGTLCGVATFSAGSTASALLFTPPSSDAAGGALPTQQGYFKRFTAGGGDIDTNSLMKVRCNRFMQYTWSILGSSAVQPGVHRRNNHVGRQIVRTPLELTGY